MIEYKYKVGDLVYKTMFDHPGQEHIVVGPVKITTTYNGDNCCDIYTDKLAFYSTEDIPDMCYSEYSLYWTREEAEEEIKQRKAFAAHYKRKYL